MTNKEKIEAVTAKLTGEFYVGQTVKVFGDNGVQYTCTALYVPASSADGIRLKVRVLETAPDAEPGMNMDGRCLHPLKYQVQPL